MSLIKAYFGDTPEPEQRAMLDRLMSSDKQKKIVQTTALMEVLQEMSPDEVQEYSDLKEQLQDQAREEIIMKRLGAGTRAAVEFRTPAVLKKLKPPGAGAVLTFQVSENAFQGYYRKVLTETQLANPRVKKHWTTSASFGTKRTQFAALRLVVNFLWKQHATCKRELRQH